MIEDRNYTNRGVPRERYTSRIVRLTILPTGVYHQQYHRPIDANVNNGVIDRFMHRFENNNDYRSSNFVGLTKGVLSYGEREGEIDIENGWNQPRLRFTMEVLTQNTMGTEIREFITGYTDHDDGVAPAGLVGLSREEGLVHVDPNLKFYVNGVVQVNERTIRGARGTRTERFMSNNLQIISDTSYEGFSQHVETRLRPADIFYAMDTTSEIGRRVSRGLGTVYDTRTAHSDEAALSHRSSVIPSFYLGRMFDGYSRTLYANEANHHDSLQAGSVFSQTANYLREDLALEDSFLDNLRNSMRLHRKPKLFTYRDLVKLDPNVERVTYGQVSTRTDRIRTHTLDDSGEWHGNGPSTTAAVMIAHTVAAIMAPMSIMFIEFTASNDNMLRGYMDEETRPEIAIPEIKIMNSTDDFETQRRLTEAFRWRIWQEVLRDISDDGNIPFNIWVICELAGETSIEISLDDSEPREYVFPSFADALATPLLTESSEAPMDIAGHVKSLLDAVIDRDQHRNRDHLYMPDDNYDARRGERSDQRRAQDYHNDLRGGESRDDEDHDDGRDRPDSSDRDFYEPNF